MSRPAVLREASERLAAPRIEVLVKDFEAAAKAARARVAKRPAETSVKNTDVIPTQYRHDTEGQI